MHESPSPRAPLAALGLSLLLATAACEETPPEPVPPPARAPAVAPAPAPARLVLLYAPCTVRRDHLAPYDGRVGTTPSLARFAREAVVFERHVTDTGQSGPAYATLLTGTGAERHGVYRHPTKLLAEALLLFEAFAAHGYETFYWNGHGAASASLGFAQGVPAGNVFARALEAEDRRFGAILARLADDPAYRALVVTNSTVAHGPYRTSYLTEFLERYPGAAAGIDSAELRRYGRLYSDNGIALSWNYPGTVARLALSAEERARLAEVTALLYESGIERVDRLFGRVLDRVDLAGLRERSVIAFTTDHGELLYREDVPFKWNHLMLLSREVLEIPLLLRAPGVAPGRYSGVSRSIDVFPTLLGLSGLPPPDEAGGPVGEDLSAALRGAARPPVLLAYSHTAVLPRGIVDSMDREAHAARWAVLRERFPDDDVRRSEVAIRAGDRSHQWRRAGDGLWTHRVFDLAADPDERRDLYDPADPRQRSMTQRLREYKERLVAGFQAASAARGLPLERERETLRSLGYID